MDIKDKTRVAAGSDTVYTLLFQRLKKKVSTYRENSKSYLVIKVLKPIVVGIGSTKISTKKCMRY